MFLFAINADLSYPVFSNLNYKFISVRVFTKSYAMGPLLQIELQTGKLSCNSEPDSVMFALPVVL